MDRWGSDQANVANERVDATEREEEMTEYFDRQASSTVVRGTRLLPRS